MLKIIFRTVIILLVSSLVAGGLYLLVNHSASALTNLPAGSEHTGLGQGQGLNNGSAEGSTQTGGHQGAGRGLGRHGAGSQNSATFDLTGILEQLTKIGLITVLVVAIQTIVKKVRKKSRSAACESALTT